MFSGRYNLCHLGTGTSPSIRKIQNELSRQFRIRWIRPWEKLDLATWRLLSCYVGELLLGEEIILDVER
jgi:hypothetical protein